MRIVFDKNVPVGVRRFLSEHEVRTFVEMEWHPQMENGELLKAAMNSSKCRCRRSAVGTAVQRGAMRDGPEAATVVEHGGG